MDEETKRGLRKLYGNMDKDSWVEIIMKKLNNIYQSNKLSESIDDTPPVYNIITDIESNNPPTYTEKEDID